MSMVGIACEVGASEAAGHEKKNRVIEACICKWM